MPWSFAIFSAVLDGNVSTYRAYVGLSFVIDPNIKDGPDITGGLWNSCSNSGKEWAVKSVESSAFPHHAPPATVQ